jgi:uncharacterized protein YndB with AHSA1/START domain
MRTTDGTAEPLAEGGYLIRFAQTYPTTPEDLWHAVTDRERLSRWMAPYEGDLRLGGHWTARYDDGSVFTVGQGTACDPPRSFTTTWHAVEEQRTTITVTVEPTEHGAALRLEHEGVGSVDYLAGWHTYLELLELDLEGDAAAAATFDWDARYRDLRTRYRANGAGGVTPEHP